MLSADPADHCSSYTMVADGIFDFFSKAAATIDRKLFLQPQTVSCNLYQAPMLNDLLIGTFQDP